MPGGKIASAVWPALDKVPALNLAFLTVLNKLNLPPPSHDTPPPASGSQFPAGETTTVQCSATDAAGNVGTASFTVRVNSLGECANAPERIAEIDAEIEGLRLEQEDAPKTLKGKIA